MHIQEKCHSSWCLLMHLYVTIPWFSLSSGTEWLFILLWITQRYFYYLFQGQGVCQYDPRANSTKTREEQNIPSHFKALFLAIPQQAFWFIPAMPFFLREAKFTPQHVITTDEGYRNLTEAVQSSTPFCFSTVFNTISTQSMFFLFSVTLKQWVMIPWYPMS